MSSSRPSRTAGLAGGAKRRIQQMIEQTEDTYSADIDQDENYCAGNEDKQDSDYNIEDDKGRTGQHPNDDSEESDSADEEELVPEVEDDCDYGSDEDDDDDTTGLRFRESLLQESKLIRSSVLTKLEWGDQMIHLEHLNRDVMFLSLCTDACARGRDDLCVLMRLAEHAYPSPSITDPRRRALSTLALRSTQELLTKHDLQKEAIVIFGELGFLKSSYLVRICLSHFKWASTAMFYLQLQSLYLENTPKQGEDMHSEVLLQHQQLLHGLVERSTRQCVQEICNMLYENSTYVSFDSVRGERVASRKRNLFDCPFRKNATKRVLDMGQFEVRVLTIVDKTSNVIADIFKNDAYKTHGMHFSLPHTHTMPVIEDLKMCDLCVGVVVRAV